VDDDGAEPEDCEGRRGWTAKSTSSRQERLWDELQYALPHQRRGDLLTSPTASDYACCLLHRFSQVATAGLASDCAATMKVVRVQTPADFDKVVGDVLANAPGPVFVVLFGSEDAETNESWCPDCVIADPLIRTAIRNVADSTLIECPVGARSEYGRDALRVFMWRGLLSLQNPRFRQGVPASGTRTSRTTPTVCTSRSSLQLCPRSCAGPRHGSPAAL